MGLLNQAIALIPAFRGLETGPAPLTSARVVEWLEGAPTSTDKRVGPESALRLSAVWDCVDMISRDIARTPLPLYRRIENGRERADTNRLYYLLHVSPNPFMTAFSFKQALQGHKMLRGNAYANIERDEDGYPIALWPLNPAMMETPIVSEGGTLLYNYVTPKGEKVTLSQSEVLHIRGLGSDGIMGYSPIFMMRELIGLGLAYQEFSGRFFSNSAQPGGALLVNKTLSQSAHERMAKSWEEYHRGLTNAHRVAILEEGVKWQQIGLGLEDAQFIQSSKLNRLEIASMWHIPAHKINELDRATFSNITEQDLDYESSALDGEYATWEQQLNKDLLLPRQQNRFYFEFLRNALVRASIDKRFEAYQRAWWMTGNEIRELENLNGIEGLDQPLLPLNMTLGAAGLKVSQAKSLVPSPPNPSRRSIRKMADGSWEAREEISDGS